MALQTITDTLKDAQGNTVSGYLLISCPALKTVAAVTQSASTLRVNLNKGYFSIQLEENTTATPTGTSYTVRYFLSDGTRVQETWVVPTGGPHTVAAVRAAVTPSPGVVVPLYQLAQGGATDGQDLRWNNTTARWEPKTLYDSTNPANLGTAAPGTQVIAARRDHIHAAADLGTAQVTGTLTVGKGGTGIASGTSGGIPGFTATTTIASSAALALNGVVLGGGAGATPTATAAGSANQPLRVPGGGGAPAFGALDLSAAAAVTGQLVAGSFPILTGDVTTPGGSLATTIAAAAVTSSKLDEKTIRYAEVSITPGAIATLQATPFELVAAPGAGKVSEFISAVPILDFTAPAFTEAGDNLVVRYTNGSGLIVSQTIETTGFIDQSADKITNALPKIDAIGMVVNAALVLHNIGAAEFGGSGGSTLRVKVAYRVHTTGL